jgi:hypothetical protein
VTNAAGIFVIYWEGCEPTSPSPSLLTITIRSGNSSRCQDYENWVDIHWMCSQFHSQVLDATCVYSYDIYFNATEMGR